MFEERKVTFGLVIGALGIMLGGVIWRRWRGARQVGLDGTPASGSTQESLDAWPSREDGDGSALTTDVDGREGVEGALRISERRFRTPIEQSPLSIHIFTPEGRSLLANTSWNKLWDLEEGEEPEGHDIYEDRQLKATGLLSYVEESIEKGVTVAAPPLLHDPAKTGREGDKKWLSASVYPVKDEEETVREMVLIIEDIAERKEAVDELEKSEERFRSIIQNSSDVVTILDADGTIRYESPASERILGYKAGERIGAKFLDYVHPEDAERAEATFAKARENPGVQPPARFRMRRKNGSWRYVEVIRNNLLDNPNVEGIVANLRDVTEQVHSEEEMRVKDRAIDASSNGVIITGPAEEGNKVLYVNPTVEKMTGYAAEEIVGHNPRFLQGVDRDQREGERLHSHIVEGRDYYGVLRNYRKDGTLFYNEMHVSPVRDEGGNITHFVGIQNDITERKNLEEQLSYQAFHDPLTGLPNRALLKDRLEQALNRAERRGEAIAILFLDLDNFKYVNDSLGHEAGDELLVEVAERLRRCVRPGDTCARLGGDEFAILLEEGIKGAEDAARVADRVTEELQAPRVLKGQEVFVGASIGIALSAPGDGGVKDLLRDADAAMYEAKRKGRDRYEFFEPGMNFGASERLSLESDLRRALARGELRLHYQPKVDLGSGRVAGVEALARWEHPEKGAIPPAKFIPPAEETGLIVPLGRWVLREACRQAKEWRERYRQGPESLTVWVNLSARQFRNAGLVEEVSEALSAAGLDPESLGLEITESTLMEYGPGTISTLSGLKELGVKLAIDDFGTGYSSLAYLKRLPVDYVKIDRSIVTGLERDTSNFAITQATVTLAHALGLGVIAEGVETAEEFARLRTIKCDFAQGYHISRPLPKEAATELLFEES